MRELASDDNNGAATWLNAKRLQPGAKARLLPGDLLEIGAQGVEAASFRVKACHVSVRQQLAQAASEGKPSEERELAVA